MVAETFGLLRLARNDGKGLNQTFYITISFEVHQCIYTTEITLSINQTSIALLRTFPQWVALNDESLAAL